MAYSNDQVIAAVNHLTQVYNDLNISFQDLVRQSKAANPLYKNGIIKWNGVTNCPADVISAEPFSDFFTVGTAVFTRYSTSTWNNKFMITLTGHTLITSPSAFPVNFFGIRFKPNKDSEGNIADGTFFILSTNADSWAHGSLQGYLLDPGTKQPAMYLGCGSPDKGSGEGISLLKSPINRDAQDFRYYQWFPFDYNKEDIRVDANGYAYFGFTGTVATTYFSGWGQAERNTNFCFSAGRTLQTGYGGSVGKAAATSSNDGGLALFNWTRAANILDVRLPYLKTGDLLISLAMYAGAAGVSYPPELIIRGNVTQVEIPYVEARYLGNFSKIMKRSSYISNRYYIVPADEVSANTITLLGQKQIRLDIQGTLSEKTPYFYAMWTESYAP